MNRFKDGKFEYTEDDEWPVDFDLLRQNLNKNTKMIMVNTP